MTRVFLGRVDVTALLAEELLAPIFSIILKQRYFAFTTLDQWKKALGLLFMFRTNVREYLIQIEEEYIRADLHSPKGG